VLAVLAAVFLVGVLWQLYRVAPLQQMLPPFTRMARLRVAKCEFGFWLAICSSRFLSVARVFVTSDAELAATVSLEKISPDFTILGLPVNQILPRGDTVKTED